MIDWLPQTTWKRNAKTKLHGWIGQFVSRLRQDGLFDFCDFPKTVPPSHPRSQKVGAFVSFSFPLCLESRLWLFRHHELRSQMTKSEQCQNQFWRDKKVCKIWYHVTAALVGMRTLVIRAALIKGSLGLYWVVQLLLIANIAGLLSESGFFVSLRKIRPSERLVERTTELSLALLRKSVSSLQKSITHWSCYAHPWSKANSKGKETDQKGFHFGTRCLRFPWHQAAGGNVVRALKGSEFSPHLDENFQSRVLRSPPKCEVFCALCVSITRKEVLFPSVLNRQRSTLFYYFAVADVQSMQIWERWLS